MVIEVVMMVPSGNGGDTHRLDEGGTGGGGFLDNNQCFIVMNILKCLCIVIQALNRTLSLKCSRCCRNSSLSIITTLLLLLSIMCTLTI